MKKLLFIFILFSSLFSGENNISNTLPHERSIIQKVAIGIGNGKNENEALNNALIDAISKLRGITTASLKQEFKNIDINISSLVQISQSSNTTLQNISNGYINDYKINKIEKTKNGWSIEILAYKYTFEKNKKAKIIVLNPNKELGENLERALNEILSKNKNFQVLERKMDFKDEDKLLKNEQTLDEEKYKFGNVLITDYVLEFKFTNASKISQNKISYYKNEKKSLDISYKLIFYPTREIILFKTINANLTFNDNKKEQKAWKKIANEINEDLNNLFSKNVILNLQKENNSSGKDANYQIDKDGELNLGF